MFKTISDKIELICAIIIIAIIFYLGKQCGSSKSIEPIPDKVITVINYRDTIFPKDTVYIDSLIPKYIPKHDTLWLPLPKDSIDCGRVFIYKDSIIKKDYNIYTTSHIQGKLRAMEVGVKLKVPLEIHDSTVIKIDSLVYKPYKYEIHTGVMVGIKNIVPTIDLSIDKCTYSLGYDPFNKQPMIGFKYRLKGWTPRNKKK